LAAFPGRERNALFDKELPGLGGASHVAHLDDVETPLAMSVLAILTVELVSVWRRHRDIDLLAPRVFISRRKTELGVNCAHRFRPLFRSITSISLR
jgi:hypothetical protein